MSSTNQEANASMSNGTEAAPKAYSFNFLQVGAARWFAKNRYVPLVFQVFMLMVFGYAIYAALVGFDHRGNNFGLLAGRLHLG